MNRNVIVFVLSLIALGMAGHVRAGHLPKTAAWVQNLERAHPAGGRDLAFIPANALTGRGAIATPDGVAHF